MQALLEEHPDFEVGYCGSTTELEKRRPKKSIDVFVVGMSSTSDTGARVCRHLVADGARVLVVISPALHGDAALSVGAHGFVQGGVSDPQILFDGLREVAECSLDPASAAPTRVVLSDREREVLAEVARGSTDRQIADELGISVRTVQSHLDHIREKTGMRRRVEFTRLAYELGLAHRDPTKHWGL
jgi:DNA-binding NarL/FixJ family response regulator